MSILTHDEAKRLSQSSTDPLEVIRNVEAAVIVKLAGMQNALKDEIRLIWKPKCDALRQQLEAAQAEIEGLATVVNLQVENYAELKEQYGALEGYFYTVTTERDAALARLAITEEANSMLLARNKWLEHTLEVAGASPVEPSQTLELEPVVRYEPERYDEDRVRMALDSDGDWVRYSDYLIAFATPQAAAHPSQAESDLRGIDAGPLSEWVDLRLRGYVSKDECLIAVKDIPKWVAQNGARLAAINAKGTPQAAAQPPAPSEAAREYMTGYSDGREWAAAPQPKETK